MVIRARSFFEIFFPLLVLVFLGQGTRFIDITHIAPFRWLFLVILFFYFFLNKKLLICYPISQKFILFIYLAWCIATSSWSHVYQLSLIKSLLFALVIITMISAGNLWVLRFGYGRSLWWLYFVLVVFLISGFLGERSNTHIGALALYGGLSGNPNNFGFLAGIVSPLILWKCYQAKNESRSLLLWRIFLISDVVFLSLSFCRSAVATFLCVLAFFCLSFPLSKKILVLLLFLLCFPIVLLSIPSNYFDKYISVHIIKDGENNKVLSSRALLWKISYRHAIEGGVDGAGFAATIGDNHYKLNGFSVGHYGREKGNSQFAILEETGIVGFILYLAVLASFFFYTIPYYRRLKSDKKIVMGLILGTITGLLVESLVEAWWDSLGPEVICFWALIGVANGLIFLEKVKLEILRVR